MPELPVMTSFFYANGLSFRSSSQEVWQLIHKIAGQQQLSPTELDTLCEPESKRLLVELVNQMVLVFIE